MVRGGLSLGNLDFIFSELSHCFSRTSSQNIPAFASHSHNGVPVMHFHDVKKVQSSFGVDCQLLLPTV